VQEDEAATAIVQNVLVLIPSQNSLIGHLMEKQIFGQQASDIIV
jgi:hypothetical protein